MNLGLDQWQLDIIYMCSGLLVVACFFEISLRFLKRKQEHPPLDVSFIKHTEVLLPGDSRICKLVCKVSNDHDDDFSVDEFVLFLGKERYSLNQYPVDEKVLPAELLAKSTLEEVYSVNSELRRKFIEFSQKPDFNKKRIRAGIRSGEYYFTGDVDPELISILLSEEKGA